MTDLGDFAAAQEPPPKGWEPYAEEIGQIGSAIVRIPTPGASRRDLLISAGFDPDQWVIKGDVQTRKWMRHDHEWLYYYKFDVTAGTESEEQRAANVEDLVTAIRSRTALAPQGPGGGQDAWLYLASDWQIGKAEGDGTPGTVTRVLESVDKARQHVLELRRLGRKMPTGALVGTGDLGEGTCGFYSVQSFMTDLNRRSQNRLVRELLCYAIDELRPLFDEFVVATVGGNHGENREGGKKITNDADNDDVAQFECIKEAYDRVGADIHWVIPEDELSILLTLGGVPVGFTHGHLFTGGGKLAQAKALEWWKGQVFGLQGVAGAHILCSSHFHHFSVINHGARTHLQTPAMDPGSKWVRDAWGSDSPAGVLTLRLDARTPLGWDDLRVLGA